MTSQRCETMEIKARIADIEAVRQMAASVSDGGPIEIVQDDTFFRCGTGRLKLHGSQLIEAPYVDLLSRQIQRTEFPNPEIT
jgi:hypothetical protein